jgi:hypothetical protein
MKFLTKHHKYSNRHTHCRGAVLVELILVSPLILFMTGFMLRLTQILEAQQVAVALSREISTQVYQNCVDITVLAPPQGGNLTVNVNDTTQQIQLCLNNIADRLNDTWPQVAPSASQIVDGVDASFRYKIQVIRYNMGTIDFGNVADEDCQATPVTNENPVGFTTINADENDGNLPDTNPNNNQICQRNRIARAVIQFNIQPLAVFLNLFNAAPEINTITITEASEI